MRCQVTLAIIVVAALCASSVFGANSVGAQTSPDPVARHRAVYQAIERELGGYQRAAASMDSLGLERQSAEGGRLEAYCDGAAIRLLVATYYGETGEATYRFYIEHDSLFFVFEETRRGRPNGRDPYPPRNIIENERFYLTGKQLIRWLATKNTLRNVKSTAAKARTKELLDDARRLSAAMPACRPKYALTRSHPTP